MSSPGQISSETPHQTPSSSSPAARSKPTDYQQSAVRRDFRKGNINFDFLQPEGAPGERRSTHRGPDRRSGVREGKRGLFNRGRTPRPVGWGLISAWAALLFGCCAATAWIVAFADSVLWLLFLPFALSIGLWSVIMLVLFHNRPR